MPPIERDHRITLNDFGDYVRVNFTKNGPTIIWFMVQFEVMLDGEPKPVVRYDSAHGFAHRDTLGWDGETINWQEMHNRNDYRAALTDAINDLTENWERYRSEFLRRGSK